jgi:hypothetical protein
MNSSFYYEGFHISEIKIYILVTFSDNVTRIDVIIVHTEIKPEFDMAEIVANPLTWHLTVIHKHSV